MLKLFGDLHLFSWRIGLTIMPDDFPACNSGSLLFSCCLSWLALAQLSLGIDTWELHCLLLVSGLAGSFCQCLHVGKVGSQHSPDDADQLSLAPVASCGWSVHPSLDEDWQKQQYAYCFTEHLHSGTYHGMTWNASMIGCYSFSVDVASCSDCLSSDLSASRFVRTYWA